MAPQQPDGMPRPARRLWLWLALGLVALAVVAWRTWPALERGLHPAPPGRLTLFHVASNWSSILSCG